MRFTRFCSAESLIGCILLPEKDEQATHILLSVFKRPLVWLEQKYDRQALLDSISAITIAKQQLTREIAWIFAIQGSFSYLDMPYSAGEWLRVGQGFEMARLKLGGGAFAVLQGEAMAWLRGRNQQRQKERIVRFLKQAVFYPYYLEEQSVRQFAMLSRVKHLSFGKALNWKDEDGSAKLAVIYRGVVGIQFRWKRRLQLAELTRGMFLTNRYIRDEVEQMDAVSLQPLRDGGEESPRFRFVSRAEETVLLIFNLRLVSESPYNVNPELRHNVKRQFEKYTRKLEEVIGFEQYNKLHRNKKSIKQELQRRKDKETIDIQLTQEMLDSHKKLSPILQTYSNMALSELPPESTITLPQQPKQFSHTVFTSISTPRLLRSKTSPIVSDAGVPNVMVHNTWVQEMTRKPKNVKSFSTLRSLSTFRAQRHQQNGQLQGELQEGKQPTFFVPNQFVKRKLKLKYQDLLSKVKNLDLSLGRRAEESVGERMRRLQSYVQSKRIVRLSAMKGKHRLLRDKVSY